MRNLTETIRAMGVNTPRPGTDDTTVPTVKTDMPAGEVNPNAAEKYKAVKNKHTQVRQKIIDDEYKHGEEDMPAEEDAFLEAKAKPDFIDIDKDGNKKETMKKAVKDAAKLSEASHATVLIQKAGMRKRIRANPNTLRKYVAAGWTVISESTEETNMQSDREENLVSSIIRRIRENKEVEQIDEISKDTIQNYRAKAVKSHHMANVTGDSKTQAKRAKYGHLSIDKMSKSHHDSMDRDFEKLGSTARTKRPKVYASESTEQIYEVLNTVSSRNSYRKKATDSLDSAIKSGDKSTMIKRDKGLDRVYDKTIKSMKKEEFIEKAIDMLGEGVLDLSFDELRQLLEAEQAKRGRGRPASAATLAKRAAEAEMRSKGQEPVKRGRGRPKKGEGPVSIAKTSEPAKSAPAASTPAPSQDAGDTQHILVQLRKASTNEPGEAGSGKNTIKYLNGTTGQVTADQARKALSMHDNLKTSGDRFKAQRRMGGSHEGLTGFISGKGETTSAKPKVSLAQPGWNKK